MMRDMMDVILLTGGQSTRFWPYADKFLMAFLGKPLLVWHYEQMVRVGIKRIVVVGNTETIKKIQEVIPPKKLSVEYAVQKGKGQVSAAYSAVSFLHDKPALFLNASDIYEDDFLKDMIEASMAYPNALSIGSISVASYFPGGYLKLRSDNTIEEIVEKPTPGQTPGDVVSLGVIAVPHMRAFGPFLKSSLRYPDDGFERAINKHIKAGIQALPCITKTTWLYLKYPWHVLSVMDACLSSIAGPDIDRSVKTGKHVTITGPVVIEKNAVIQEGTKIVGPAFIGEGTIIGNNNLIRNSHIGRHCVTGFSTDITRSYIGDNSWFHSNYIGDSVIGENVSMGSGTVLANLRLDESAIASSVKGEIINTTRTKLGAMIGSGVRIGVNVSVMPGVKIGSRSFVGAGVILAEDLPDGKYCRATPTVVITENSKQAAPDREEFKKKLR